MSIIYEDVHEGVKKNKGDNKKKCIHLSLVIYNIMSLLI